MGENESLRDEKHFYRCAYATPVPFPGCLRALLTQVFRQSVLEICNFNPVYARLSLPSALLLSLSTVFINGLLYHAAVCPVAANVLAVLIEHGL